MGYRIDYGPAMNIPTARRNGAARLRTMIAVMLLIFVLMVRLTWQEGTAVLQEVLLPGNLTVAQQAFSELVCDLREGERFMDALTFFCRMILDEAA